MQQTHCRYQTGHTWLFSHSLKRPPCLDTGFIVFSERTAMADWSRSSTARKSKLQLIWHDFFGKWERVGWDDDVTVKERKVQCLLSGRWTSGGGSNTNIYQSHSQMFSRTLFISHHVYGMLFLWKKHNTLVCLSSQACGDILNTCPSFPICLAALSMLTIPPGGTKH